ncbi:MAG: amidohydrolase [Halioglobus sp.]
MPMKKTANNSSQKPNSAFHAVIKAIAFSIMCSATYAGQVAQTPGLSPALHVKVKNLVDEHSAQVEAIFKDIHQNPELGFMEVRTAGLVEKELLSLGFEVETGIGKTGVLAILRNGEGPTVLYRADMDANAVEENTDLPYASTARATLASGEEVPVAHMCGHDAHVSWMLGMAHVMSDLKEHWRGTLVLVAQPAEELIAGAAAMLKDGLYSRYSMPEPDYMLALHSVPIPTGSVINVSGVRYAGTDQLDVTFYGFGGHGSMPQHTKDPVVMAANAIMQYQTIVSRNIDPQQAAVLTVGSVQAGTSNNVIPDKAVLKINLRWFSDSVRHQLIEGIKRINKSIATANALPEDKMPVIEMKGHSSPLVNDVDLTARLSGSFAGVVSKQQIIESAPAAMASEDAHLLLADNTEVPLAYIMIGVASPEAFAEAGNRPPYFNHNGDYKVELDAIPFGSQIATTAVLDLLAQ